MFVLGWNFSVWFPLFPFSLAPQLCVCPCFQPVHSVTMRRCGTILLVQRTLRLGVGSFLVWEWSLVGFLLGFFVCWFVWGFCFCFFFKMLSFWLVCRSWLFWSWINATLLYLKQMRVWNWLELKCNSEKNRTSFDGCL